MRPSQNKSVRQKTKTKISSGQSAQITLTVLFLLFCCFKTFLTERSRSDGPRHFATVFSKHSSNPEKKGTQKYSWILPLLGDKISTPKGTTNITSQSCVPCVHTIYTYWTYIAKISRPHTQTHIEILTIYILMFSFLVILCASFETMWTSFCVSWGWGGGGAMGEKLT